MTPAIRCVAPTGDPCGEGVLWHPVEQSVYWTDINGFLVHSWDSATSSVKSWFFDEPVTSVLLSQHPHLLVPVLASGVLLWESDTNTRHDPFFRLPAVRLNNAGVDAFGKLWVGSMRNNANRDGSEGEAEELTAASSKSQGMAKCASGSRASPSATRSFGVQIEHPCGPST